MKIILANNFQAERKARSRFFTECTNLWFITTYKDRWVELKSVPTNALDVCFIIGHNNFVKEYIVTHKIQERIIVIITCNLWRMITNLRFNKSKTVYLAKADCWEIVWLLKGSEYGFSFDLTASELYFFNTPITMPLLQRLDKSFDRIQKPK